MKRDYLSRLSRAARWYLPPAEAAEVLEDYRELIEQAPRSEEELRQDLGTPKDAVRQLVQMKAYHRWLNVFTVLGYCVLLPALGPIWSRLFWWNGINWVVQLDWAFLLVGAVLSFLWFQRNGSREKPMPKGPVLLLVIPLIGMSWCWFIALSSMYRIDAVMRYFAAHPGSAVLVHWSLLLDCLLMGLVGLFGLTRARLSDRRWRAVYVLGLAGTVLGLSVWTLLSSMDLTFSADWQTRYLIRYIGITLLGLIGTGVSLC